MEDLISSIFSQPMEQIIKSLSAKFNLPESTVRSGIGIVLRFLKEKSDGTRFATLLARIPGAEDAMKMRAQKRNFEFDPSASSAVFFGIEA